MTLDLLSHSDPQETIRFLVYIEVSKLKCLFYTGKASSVLLLLNASS